MYNIYHDPISLMLEHQLMPNKQLKFRVKAQPNKHKQKIKTLTLQMIYSNKYVSNK